MSYELGKRVEFQGKKWIVEKNEGGNVFLRTDHEGESEHLPTHCKVVPLSQLSRPKKEKG